MKRLIPTLALLCLFNAAFAQITITSSDMPVSGDTLRYSIADATALAINLNDTGTNKSWDFSNMTPIAQGVDSYKTAAQVNVLYALTISPTAYGYKVADSLPIGGVLPITIQDLYTFFNITNSNTKFEAVAFAANISGLPTPANYSTPDTWYNFPLTYQNSDSSNYSLTFTLPTIGSLKQAGYRKTRVDSWGNIKTPHYPTGVDCIRVRSEIHEVDSVNITLLNTTLGIPRDMVEYKWLSTGHHYPAMWVTTTLVAGTETPTTARYRDDARTLAIANTAALAATVIAYPVPAANGIVTLEIPTAWKTYTVDIYDLQSKKVAGFSNTSTINISALPAGQYVARIMSGTNVAYTRIQK